MNAEELKHKIQDIFGKQVLFNSEFDYYAEAIKNIEDNLLLWCRLIKERKIKPISKSILGSKVVFIKKMGSSNRCIIIKLRNDGVQEVHLGNHDYYNQLTK